MYNFKFDDSGMIKVDKTQYGAMKSLAYAGKLQFDCKRCKMEMM